MAVQPISDTAAVYSKGGYERDAAARVTRSVGAPFAGGSLVREVPLRPLGVATPAFDVGGFQAVGAQRPFSPAIAAFASGSIQSLENLRLLSLPIAAYAVAGLLRSSATRPIQPGYILAAPAPELPPVDSTPPTVGNFTPPPGTPISKTTAVSFDVTEDSGNFQRIFVVAFFPSTGIAEVIHDGDGFRGFYTASSSRTMIAGGFRYAVLRSGGWPAPPTIQTFAIDRAGNEAN